MFYKFKPSQCAAKATPATSIILEGCCQKIASGDLNPSDDSTHSYKLAKDKELWVLMVVDPETNMGAAHIAIRRYLAQISKMKKTQK